jgi:2-dehydropantoate 2-reductase
VGLALGYALESIRRAEPAVWLAADAGDAGAFAQIDEAIRAELPRMTEENYSGTAQDLCKGRRTEVDFMNGYVAAQGRQIGVPAPTHERIAALVRKAERGELAPHPDNIVQLID